MTSKVMPIQVPSKQLTNVADRTFGVEIEVVGTPLSVVRKALDKYGFKTQYEKSYDVWSVVEDVSLSCDDCIDDVPGYCYHRAEIVSPILTGDEGLFELGFMLKTLREIGAYTNKTCGTHVHVGAVDYIGNLYTQAVVMTRYAGLGFDKAAGRVSEDYAPVMYDAEDIAKYVEECDRGWGDRYNAINLTNLRLSKRTIEFRQLAGTLDYNTLQRWVCAVTNLVHEAAEGEGCHLCLSKDHTYEFCQRCSTGYCSGTEHDIFCEACDSWKCNTHTTWNCPVCGGFRCVDDYYSDDHRHYCYTHHHEFCGTETCPRCDKT